MPGAIPKAAPLTLKKIVSAAKKLSAEDRQLLRQQLFADIAIAEMKAFELSLKKKKQKIRMSDEAIVKLTGSVRRKRNEKTNKVLH